MLASRSQSHDPSLRLTLIGELDSTCASTFDAVIHAFRTCEHSSLTLDMSRVPFADARCLAMLDTLAAMAAARGGELVVLRPSRPVVRVLRLTGVDRLVSLDGVPEQGRTFSGE